MWNFREREIQTRNYSTFIQANSIPEKTISISMEDGRSFALHQVFWIWQICHFLITNSISYPLSKALYLKYYQYMNYGTLNSCSYYDPGILLLLLLFLLLV